MLIQSGQDWISLNRIRTQNLPKEDLKTEYKYNF